MFSHNWTGIKINKAGTYKIAVNARDVKYPTPGDGNPHQASEGSGIAYAEVKVVPTFAEWALIISGVLFVAAFIFRQRGLRLTGLAK